MTQKFQSRRRFLQNAAFASVATFAAPYVKTAHSAGKLSLGIWDHWVPGVNAVLRTICEEWGSINGVEVTVDLPAAEYDEQRAPRVEGAGSMKFARCRRRFATTEVLQRDGSRRRSASRE